MVSENKWVQTFMKLGLTSVQTMIYIALVNLGEATAGLIAEKAQLDRSEVYRGLSELQKIGLVEKIIESPNIFRGIPWSSAVSILLERKTKEYNEIKASVEQLIAKSEDYKNTEHSQGVKHQFIMIPKKETALLRWIKATEKAQQSLDYIIRWEGFVEGITQRNKHIQKLIEKGIRVRGIVSEPKNQRAALRIITNLKKKGSYNVRFIPTQPQAVFSIIDKKEILFNTVTTPLPRDTPSIWSNNPCIVSVIQEYFELKWREAEKFTKRERLHHESLCEVTSGQIK